LCLIFEKQEIRNERQDKRYKIQEPRYKKPRYKNQDARIKACPGYREMRSESRDKRVIPI
jgi:hypothetical protein